ncbi:MAG: ATP synthase subunit I, partial [Actinomycetota bacterium]|nr:ATP synthase subunit I [Actinomycetota bacterium]
MTLADRMAAAATVSPADLEGGAPELDVAWDLAKRALPVAAVLIAASAIGWQVHGALTTGFAVGVVVLNFLAAAALMAWAARISLSMLMGAVLIGYVVRMAVVALAVFAVKDQSWVVLPLLGFTLVLTHLGLLFWETKHLSVSLAYPGLKPQP